MVMPSLEIRRIWRGTPRCRPHAPVVATLLLSACTLQPDYHAAKLVAPETWPHTGQPTASLTTAEPALAPADDAWWMQLHDPDLNALIDAAMAHSPSLAAAAAHVDEARATLGEQTAATRPTVSLSGSMQRSRVQGGGGGIGGNGASVVGDEATGGPTFSWEADLFGKLRLSQQAARDRLDARTADAAAARLSLSSSVATAYNDARVCRAVRTLRADDIASWRSDARLTEQKATLGFAAPADASRARSALADARVRWVDEDEQCERTTNSLVELTGLPVARLDAMLADAEARREHADTQAAALPALPAPRLVLGLPAPVLLRHPNVVAAEREVAATYAEIGVARANRLPTVNLTAALTGTWISALGTSWSYFGWTLMPGLNAMLYDGGNGKAAVNAASARYLAAVANLRQAVDAAYRDIANALAAQRHAHERLAAALVSRDAARHTLEATEGQWRAGSVSLFQLESTRRQTHAEQEAAFNAAHASVQAWIDVVRASGNAAVMDQACTDASPASRCSARN
jgi:outer membrane protein, multidrug efflux system